MINLPDSSPSPHLHHLASSYLNQIGISTPQVRIQTSGLGNLLPTGATTLNALSTTQTLHRTMSIIVGR